MSRHRRSEIGFGSDSFLDIIANIVGILIILIVVAGLRVSHAPVPVAIPPSEKPTVADSAPEPSPAVPKIETPAVAPAVPIPRLPLPPAPANSVPAIARAPEPLPPVEPDPGLLAAINRLEGEIAAIQRETAVMNARAARRRKANIAARRTLADAEARTRTEQAGLARLNTKLAELDQQLNRKRNELTSLRLQYDEAKRRSKTANVIRHKLTPVSSLVKGKEIHFRLFTGKVALVPIEALVKMMRKDVVAQKDWLIKFRQHQGEVGPLGGFSMKYVVQRKQTSSVDQLRNGGYGQISIVLSEWRIVPSRDLHAETADEALQVGSAFLRELRATDPSTTLTFWVYPDSFPLFRALQKRAHREGFTVAARPLPFGVPIAGSPRGTRSAGQ